MDVPELAASGLDEVTIKLRKPLQLTKESTLEELTLRPVGRAFRDFSIPMKEDGSFEFQPYPLAVVGLKMAGQSAAAAKLVDQLHPKDMVEIAGAVFHFFG